MNLKLIPSDEVSFDGEFNIKLFLPYDSNLSQSLIDRISSIASWNEDPNILSDAVLSGRSVIINDDANNYGLQISGVGYLPVSIGLNNDSALGVEGELFLPPSNNNFLNNAVSKNHNGPVMGVTIPSSKKSVYGTNFYELINHFPDYKPAGTYDFSELCRKVKFTSEVSKLNLDKLLIPSVKAYGYYLSDELRNNDGPFGFIVTTMPGMLKQRFAQELFNQGASINSLINGLSIMASGLRVLHDKGYSHLEPHASNFYLVSNKPYLMDWSTAHKLSSDNELNILYRAIDLSKLINNFESIMKLTGNFNFLVPKGISLILGSYVNDSVNLTGLVSKLSRFKNSPSDFDVIVQLLLDYNVESFNVKPKRILVKPADEGINSFIKNNRIKCSVNPKKSSKYDNLRKKNSRF